MTQKTISSFKIKNNNKKIGRCIHFYDFNVLNSIYDNKKMLHCKKSGEARAPAPLLPVSSALCIYISILFVDSNNTNVLATVLGKTIRTKSSH